MYLFTNDLCEHNVITEKRVWWAGCWMTHLLCRFYCSSYTNGTVPSYVVDSSLTHSMGS